MSMDQDEVCTLLHIVDLCKPTSYPNLRAIHDEAMAQLQEINDALKESKLEQRPRPEPRAIPAQTTEIERRV